MYILNCCYFLRWLSVINESWWKMIHSTEVTEVTEVNVGELPLFDVVLCQFRLGVHDHLVRCQLCSFLIKFLQNHVDMANLTKNIYRAIIVR